MKPRFKIGDWLHYKGVYEGYICVENIAVHEGVVYYYEQTTHSFIEDYPENSNLIEKVSEDTDEKFKRYKTYLELKKEFENVSTTPT